MVFICFLLKKKKTILDDALSSAEKSMDYSWFCASVDVIFACQFYFNSGANRPRRDSGKTSSLSRGYCGEYYFPFRLNSDVRHTGRARLLLRSRLSAATSKPTGTHKSSVDGSLFIFQISRDLVYTCSADLTGQINTSERSFAPPPQPSPRNTPFHIF